MMKPNQSNHNEFSYHSLNSLINLTVVDLKKKSNTKVTNIHNIN